MRSDKAWVRKRGTLLNHDFARLGEYSSPKFGGSTRRPTIFDTGRFEITAVVQPTVYGRLHQ